MLPSPDRASSNSASGSAWICSASAMRASWSATLRAPIVRSSNSCERDRMVSGILCSSVVAIMKTTWGGGSSTDLSKALNELFDSMCTSSMMKIL